MEFANYKGREQRRGRFKGKVQGVRLIGFLILGVFLTACALKKEPDLFWPPPPDKPRIKFLYSFSSLNEFGASVLKNILLGEEKFSDFRKPYDIHIDNDGSIYITDTGYGRVQFFDRKKKEIMNIGGGILRKPMGVDTDSAGLIYVSDSIAADKLYVFGRNGKLIKTIGKKGDLIWPGTIAINNTIKRLYVTDSRKHQVVVFDLNTGERLFDIGKRGKKEGELNFPIYITMDSQGKIYVGDIEGRVQIFDQDGNFIKSFGQLGDRPGMFARPKGMGLDSEGNIYVVDASFNNVQIFNSEGQVLMFFGGGGDGRGRMGLPAGLAIDSEDRIYVVDQWNVRVNVYQYLGEKYKAIQKK